MLPGRAHAETGRTNGFGTRCFLKHLLHFQQFFFLKTGVVVTGLRTVLAVFRASACLDRQQRGNLHTVGVEMSAVHRLRLKQQVIEWLYEQRPDLG